MPELSRREILASAAAVTAATAIPYAAVAAAGAPGDRDTQTLLSGIAEHLLTEYPENATYLGIDTGRRAP